MVHFQLLFLTALKLGWLDLLDVIYKRTELLGTRVTSPDVYRRTCCQDDLEPYRKVIIIPGENSVTANSIGVRKFSRVFSQGDRKVLTSTENSWNHKSSCERFCHPKWARYSKHWRGVVSDPSLSWCSLELDPSVSFFLSNVTSPNLDTLTLLSCSKAWWNFYLIRRPKG